jgi:hypothetical protein
MSSVTPIPRINKFPPVNNPGVYQSAPSEFTLKHPKDHSGATASMTIRFPSIFEIFDHHDAVLELTHVSVQLKPEPLSWDEFTKIWNAHAAENDPRFVTWDFELAIYVHPLIIVTLDDLNLTPRSPNVISDASTLKRVVSNVSVKYKASSATTTTTTTTTTSFSTSMLDLPGKLLEDLFSIKIACSVHRDMHQTAYFGERDRKRKARSEVVKHQEDVVMSDEVISHQPSTSTTSDRAPVSGT